jgi:two-component system OmpR family response regulator
MIPYREIQVARLLAVEPGRPAGDADRRRTRRGGQGLGRSANAVQNNEFAGGEYESCMSNFDQGRGSRGGATKTGHIVIVDDDPAMHQVVARYFEDHNVPVSAVSDRVGLNHHLAATNPCLILLDLRLGQDDGLDLLREIRTYSDVPIIMTSHRLDEIDRVVGLELGADDYIVKPFGVRELLARVRAVLRRQEMGRVTRTRDHQRGGYRFGGWQLERGRRRLVDPNGSPVSLSKGEYALLLAFLESPQRPLTREQLLQATRVHEDILDRSIDVQVLRLRRKLEDDPNAPSVILTERGIGYIFAATVEPF